MGLGPEAVVVTHLGGVYGEHEGPPAAASSEHYERLPEAARRRLVLEHDDSRFGVADIALGTRAHRHPADLRQPAPPAE